MKISFENQTLSLNQTAAVLLAVAVIELFPNTQIVRGEGTSKYFYYDFVFPFSFGSEFLPMIEEHMRKIVKEKREIRHLEMMASNASLLMRHLHQQIVADQLLQAGEEIVPMLQIDSFTLFSPLPALEKLCIPFFKILEIFYLKSFQSKTVRIVGATSPDKKVLKQMAQQRPFSSQSHVKLASDLGWCELIEETGFWYWRPKGNRVRQMLIRLWEEEIERQSFEWIVLPFPFMEGEYDLSHAHHAYFLKFGTTRIAQMAWMPNADFNDSSLGLLSSKAFFGDRAQVFCPDEKLLEECISSLRFILKIPKILGFEFEIVLSVSSVNTEKSMASSILLEALEKIGVKYTIEKRSQKGDLASVKICFADFLERKWTGPFLKISNPVVSSRNTKVLTFSAFGSLERICALLLEKKGGWIPFWLAPEQVRLVMITDQAVHYVKEVEEALRSEGIRVTVDNKRERLNARLYHALLEKVPYILVVGEREHQTKTLLVRAYGDCEEHMFSCSELCMRLKREVEDGISEFKN